jgi:DNA-binding FadR family transcriptional regulator
MSSSSAPARTDARRAARSPGKRFRIPKAAELVARQLRNQIVRGELKEGETLSPEGELMESFGVSRPTLREAVRILESEGLISVTRGARGGAVVHRPDINVATRHISFILQSTGATLVDVYRVRMLVEPVAARAVAESTNKSAARVLRACLTEGQTRFDNDVAYGAAIAEFHNKLVELAGIPVLSLLMGMLNDIFSRFWRDMTVDAGRETDNAPAKRRGLRAVEKLIDLIEKGDGPGAEAHWRNHTVAVDRMLRKLKPAMRVIDLLDHH